MPVPGLSQNINQTTGVGAMRRLVSSTRPKHPRNSDQDFDPPRQPENAVNLADSPGDPTPRDSTNKNTKEPQRPPIPLRILLPGQLRVGGEVAEHRGHDQCRDFANGQNSAPDHLSRRLETQQRDRNFLLPVYIL